MFKRAFAASLVVALAGCTGQSTESSSGVTSSSAADVSTSSSVMSSSSAEFSSSSSSEMLSSSSAAISSSSLAAPSSSSIHASTSSASPEEDCNVIVAAGESLYSGCVGCHGELQASGVTAGGPRGAITATDSAWGEDNEQISLAQYISENMGGYIGGCDMACGESIAAYLTHETSSATCPLPGSGSSSSAAPAIPAVAVPAIIESEDYVGAEDSTPENKGSCGPVDKAVDLQPKTTGGGSCDVNWTDPGEWLEYRVSVESKQRFDFYVSLASVATNKAVSVTVNGQSVGTVVAPAQGWTTFESIKAGSKELTAGEHTVRITIDTGALNVDQLELRQHQAEPPYVPSEEELNAGYKFWTESCDTCHGDKGEGSLTYPYAIDLLVYTRGELIQKIFTTMPPGTTPEVACDMTCATNTADFMLNGYPGIDDGPVLGCDENPLEQHPNTPIRLLTSSQYSKLITQVFAPLNLNMANLMPEKTFVDDKNATGFVSNTGITAGKSNVEKMIEMAEAIGTKAGNNFGKLMDCDVNDNCVKDYIRKYGEQLYRGALSNTQQNELFALYNANKNTTGIGHVTAAMLMAGSTVYQYEQAVNNRQLLQPREIAERMSFLIWGMPADKALLDKAASGALNTENGIRTQAQAMLADARAAEGLRTFYDDYLKIPSDYKVVGHDSVGAIDVVPKGECTSTAQCREIYPNLGANDCKDSKTAGYCLCDGQICDQLTGPGEATSGADFTVTGKEISDEIMRFTSYLTRQSNGSFEDLMSSRKAFVDDTMAKIYGVVNAANNSNNNYLGGSEVDLPVAERSGLLTRAGFSIYGAGEKVGLTSPTQRGEHVRKHILCQEPPAIPGDPPPFPDIPDPKEKTWVEVLKEIHLTDNDNDPSTPNTCVACHEAIDPVGFAFENYTLNGQYITAYPNGRAIDAAGWLVALNDGSKDYDDTTFNDALELSDILGGSDDAAACFAETWMSYALARTIVGSAQDSCAAQQLKDDFKANNYSLKELIVSIVTNPAFRFRNPE